MIPSSIAIFAISKMKNRRVIRAGLFGVAVLLIVGIVLGVWNRGASHATCPTADPDSYRFVQLFDKKGIVEMQAFLHRSAGSADGGAQADILDAGIYKKFYKQIFSPGVALDVGAYVGTQSMLMSQVGYEVHAFEPYKQSHDILMCNAALREGVIASKKNIMVIKGGISDRTGAECAIVPMSTQPEHFILIGGDAVFKCPANQTVSVTTLDEYWQNALNKRHISFIRLDMEGHEYMALKGASKLIETDPPPFILVKYFERIQSMKKASLEDMLDIVNKSGYRLFDCSAQVEIKGEAGKKVMESYKGSMVATDLLMVHSKQVQGDLPNFECGRET